MSAAKQWEITRAELTNAPAIGKLYNAKKFEELNSQLRTVVERFSGHNRIRTFARMIVEEVTNILNKNGEWHTDRLIVRTEYNKPHNEVGRLKVDLIYAGTEYWDPEDKQTTTVIGSKDKFQSYSRSVKFEGNRTQIKINIEIVL